MHRAALRLWPHEATTFEPLLVKIHPVHAPPQEFDQITSAAAEADHVPGEGILLERGLYLRGQRVHPAAHVGHAGRQPHASATRQRIHRCDSASITTRSMATSTTPVRRTRASGNSISIKPPAWVVGALRRGEGELCFGTEVCTAVPCDSSTVTGSNAADLGVERASSRR